MAAKIDSKIAEIKENRVLGVRLFHLFSDRLTDITQLCEIRIHELYCP